MKLEYGKRYELMSGRVIRIISLAKFKEIFPKGSPPSECRYFGLFEKDITYTTYNEDGTQFSDPQPAYEIIKCLGDPKPQGYHLTPIAKGKYGEFSKIQEEVAEVEDFIKQGNKIGELNELADLYGAMEAYLEKHHPGYTMSELRVMSNATKRAFESGARKNSDLN